MRACIPLVALLLSCPVLAFETPNSFKQFKLGMPLSALSSVISTSNIRVRESVHVVTDSKLKFSKMRRFETPLALNSGEFVTVNLCFYKSKLAVISVLYGPGQSFKLFSDVLTEKYGDFTDHSITYWGSVKILNFYWEASDCCIVNFYRSGFGTTELIYADKAAQKAIKAEIEADNKVAGKSKFE